MHQSNNFYLEYIFEHTIQLFFITKGIHILCNLKVPNIQMNLKSISVHELNSAHIFMFNL